MEIQSSQPIDYVPRTPGRQFAKSVGRPINSVNLHSKQPSSIATRLRKAGIDWVADLAAAIKANDLTRINMWMKLLSYLVVTNSVRRTKRPKRASKSALAALDELEGK